MNYKDLLFYIYIMILGSQGLEGFENFENKTKIYIAKKTCYYKA